MGDWFEGLEPGTYFGNDGIVVAHDDNADGIVDRVSLIGADGSVDERFIAAAELDAWAGAEPGMAEAPGDRLEGWWSTNDGGANP